MPKKSKRTSRKPRMSKELLIQEQQVVLSKERTILSFMRTALTLIGVGAVLVNVLKEPFFQTLGYAIIIIGFVEILDSFRRLRSKQKMMDELQKRV